MDNDTDQRRRFQNGFLRSNLFIFFMGQIVTFLIALTVFAVGWGKLSQQFIESMEWRSVTQIRLERMDKEGTNASRYGLDSERSRLANLEGRVQKTEEETRRIDVMKEKIDRLEGTQRPGGR